MRVVRIPDAFKRNVCIEIRFAAGGLERQVVVAMPLDVVQHKTPFLLSRANATSALYMRGVRGWRLAGGLLAQQTGGCDKNRS